MLRLVYSARPKVPRRVMQCPAASRRAGWLARYLAERLKQDDKASKGPLFCGANVVRSRSISPKKGRAAEAFHSFGSGIPQKSSTKFEVDTAWLHYFIQRVQDPSCLLSSSRATLLCCSPSPPAPCALVWVHEISQSSLHDMEGTHIIYFKSIYRKPSVIPITRIHSAIDVCHPYR